ncbi:flocculation protein FLO11-like isoform X3 [Vespula squamosa]|uniref:Flocculation protein FLO11-like isoform X3 n=1 Tax=Vespula squamosa TaxID=30214 RepID=A0ABD1ZWZ6_VESSQ
MTEIKSTSQKITIETRHMLAHHSKEKNESCIFEFIRHLKNKRTTSIKRGSQSVASYEDLSSSSFSSASRASLDARSSPTPSYGAENMMVFPGDSSGSI